MTRERARDNLAGLGGKWRRCVEGIPPRSANEGKETSAEYGPLECSCLLHALHAVSKDDMRWQRIGANIVNGTGIYTA